MNEKITWTTEKRRLGDLRDWEKNPRQLSKHDAEHIGKSLDRFGLADPLIINADNSLIGGHQRKRIIGDPDALVDVRVPSRQLTEREAEELAIRLNKNSGDWDWDILANQFEVPDLMEWGFSEEELTGGGFDLEPEPPDDPGAQIDRKDALADEYGTVVGQVWQLGRHRLAVGDCTDSVVVQSVMDIQPGIMVTDPPYGVEYDPEWRLDANVADVVHGHKLKNDDRADWREAWQLFSGDVVYIRPAGAKSKTVAESIEASGFELLYLIIWNKDLAVFGRGDYHHKHEPCWYAVRKGKKHNFVGDRTQKTVWDIPTIHSFANGHNSEEWGLVGHGTQKPVECMERPIRNHGFDIIYDPFLGSGTTLVACERLGRTCRAIEIDPGYVAVAIKRWEDLTGEKAVLLNGQSDQGNHEQSD